MAKPLDQIVDTRAFDRDWLRWVSRTAPDDVVWAVNELAKVFRKLLVAASPVGRSANAERARRRSLKGIRGRGYGPIKKAWSRRATKRIKDPATVINRAFYAPLVEFGAGAHTIRVSRHRQVLSAGRGGPVFGPLVRHPGTRARPFAAPVVNRAGAIASQTLNRILPRR